MKKGSDLQIRSFILAFKEVSDSELVSSLEASTASLASAICSFDPKCLANMFMSWLSEGSAASAARCFL